MTRAESRPWASATFVGERHRIEVVAAGDAAAALDDLEDAEFSLSGHLVASIAVATRGGGGRAVIEALTLLEA